MSDSISKPKKRSRSPRQRPNKIHLSSLIRNNIMTNERLDREELKNAQQRLSQYDSSGKPVQLMTSFFNRSSKDWAYKCDCGRGFREKEEYEAHIKLHAEQATMEFLRKDFNIVE